MKKKYLKISFIICIVLLLINCENNKPIVEPIITKVDTIASLSCDKIVVGISSIQINTAFSGTVSIPYTGGSGLSYLGGYTVKESGITAILQAGKLTTGTGSIVFNISGTPTKPGINNFPIQFGGKTCTFSLNVNSPNLDTPSISALNCAGSTISATIYSGTLFNGTMSIPYSGGNTSAFATGIAIPSTQINGLTATLQGGTLSNSGNLVFNINGTAANSGIANFNILFAGKTCTVSLTVSSPQITYLNSIKTIMDLNCATPNCHNTVSNADGFNLSSYTATKNYASTKQAKFLGSIKHTSGYKSMPQGAAKLPDSTINKIQLWINANYPE